MIKKSIEIPLYRMSLKIVLNQELKFTHQGYDNEIHDERVGVVLNNEDKVILVLNEYTYSDLVHECVHVAQCVHECTGINDDESMAYLTTWTFEKVCDFIKKNNIELN